MTGILRWVNYLPSINSARYTQRIIQTVKSRLTADCPPMSIVSEKANRLDPPHAVLHFRPDQCFIQVHEWFGFKVPEVPVYKP